MKVSGCECRQEVWGLNVAVTLTVSYSSRPWPRGSHCMNCLQHLVVCSTAALHLITHVMSTKEDKLIMHVSSNNSDHGTISSSQVKITCVEKVCVCLCVSLLEKKKKLNW